MVVAVGVIVGFCAAELEPSEPVHDQEVALLEFALRVTVPLLQIGPLFVAPVDVGDALTVTVVVYTVAGVQPLPIALSVNE